MGLALLTVQRDEISIFVGYVDLERVERCSYVRHVTGDEADDESVDTAIRHIFTGSLSLGLESLKSLKRLQPLRT